MILLEGLINPGPDVHNIRSAGQIWPRKVQNSFYGQNLRITSTQSYLLSGAPVAETLVYLDCFFFDKNTIRIGANRTNLSRGYFNDIYWPAKKF